MTEQPKKKFRWPPLTPLWVLALFVVPMVLKPMLGWPGPPPPGPFDATTRFWQHFLADSALGLPVFIPFMAILLWINRPGATPGKPTDPK
jgi:hypothetical protein